MRFMSASVLSALLVLATGTREVHSQARTFEFGGWRLRDSISSRDARSCASPPTVEMLTCMGEPRDVGSTIVVPMREFHERRLARLSLTFATEGFDEIMRGLSLVYGEPDSTGTVEYQTRVGGRLLGRIIVWRLDLGPLTLSEFAEDSRFGSAVVVDTAAMRAWRGTRDDALRRSLARPGSQLPESNPRPCRC